MNLSDLLIYDDASHEYQIFSKNPVHIPSVSELMAFTGVAKNLSRYTPSDALSRGSFIHSMASLYDEHLDLNDAIPADWRLFHQAYRSFHEDYEVKPGNKEQVVMNEVLLYAGRYDRLWQIEGELHLTGIETGRLQRWHLVREAAYALAMATPVKLSSLYLKADGTYFFKEWDEESQEAAYRTVEAMSQCYWFSHPKNFLALMNITTAVA